MSPEGRRPSASDTGKPQFESESVPTVPQPVEADSEEVEFESEGIRTALLSARPEGEEGHQPILDATADEPPVGSLIAGRYELLRRVAGGSMGVVFKALDRRATIESHEPAWVALKLLRANLERHGPALRALQREAQTGLLLDHPNIVRFQGLERDGNRFFIVMEWLPGRSLAEWLDAHPGEPMSIQQVMAILRELGAALEYAHRQGVVHADVKPGNVMLLPDGSVRLCDFGIARFDKLLATRSGSFDPSVLRAATPAYSSPEVLRGETPQVEDDVYSLGSLTYRLLAGRRVFGRRDAAAAEEAGDSAAPIRRLEPRRWDALRRALSLQRDCRQASVRQFVTEFAGTAPPPGARRRRHATVVLTLLVGGLATIALLTPRSADEPGRRLGVSPRPAATLAEEGAALSAEPPAANGAGADVVSAAGTARNAELTPSSTARDSLRDADTVSATAENPTTGTDVVPQADPTDTAFQSRPVLILDLADGERRGAEAELRLGTDESPATVRLRRATDLMQELPVSIDSRPVPDRRGPGISVVLPSAESLSFPAGSSRLDFPLRLIADARGDVAAWRLELRGPGGARLGSLTVSASDRLPVLQGAGPDIVGFRDDRLSVREDGTAVRVELIRYNAGAGPLSVGLRVRDGTALAGEDFELPAGGEVWFAAGETGITVFLPLIDDAVREAPEFLRLVLDGSAAAPGVLRELSVEIGDDD